MAAIKRISALRRTVEITEFRDGNDPSPVRRLPGRLVYEPITLERSLDADRSFEYWIDQLGEPAGRGSGILPQEYPSRGAG